LKVPLRNKRIHTAISLKHQGKLMKKSLGEWKQQYIRQDIIKRFTQRRLNIYKFLTFQILLTKKIST